MEVVDEIKAVLGDFTRKAIIRGFFECMTIKAIAFIFDIFYGGGRVRHYSACVRLFFDMVAVFITRF